MLKRPCKKIGCALFVAHPPTEIHEVAQGYIVKHRSWQKYLWLCERHYNEIVRSGEMKDEMEDVNSIDGVRLDLLSTYFIYAPCKKQFVTAVTLPDGTVDLDYWDVEIVLDENNQPAVQVSFDVGSGNRAVVNRLFHFSELEVLDESEDYIYIARHGEFE